MRYCCPFNFFPNSEKKSPKPPRKVIAWDLDETLFFAQTSGTTLQELITERWLAPAIIHSLIDHSTASCNYSPQLAIHFLHKKELSRLFKRLQKNNISIVFITSGAWHPQTTIRLINYALDLNLPMHTHFISCEVEKAKRLCADYPDDDICLVENDIYHIEQAKSYANVTTIRAKHNVDSTLDTHYHLKEINKWMDYAANLSQKQSARKRTCSFETTGYQKILS